MNNNGNNSSTEEDSSRSQNQGWVTKRDRHMQLINTSILDQETQARSKAMEETRRQRAAKRDQQEKQKIIDHLDASKAVTYHTASSVSVHEIVVDGLKFHVLQGGSKLARIRGEKIDRLFPHYATSLTIAGSTDSGSSTPKQAIIGGVTFMRSKNGNLYRSGIVKAKK